MVTEVAITVEPEEAGRRLDVVIAESACGISRSHARQLIDDGHVTVNGAPRKASYHVETGDRIQIEVAPRPELSAEPEELELAVLYRDADMAVIDKPAGLVVHPAAGHEHGTLANALAGMFPQSRELASRERPGIVHRLDKDTSGLMVVALSARGQQSLQRQIANRTLDRRYLALVRGHPPRSEGIIDAPIGRDPKQRKRMAVHGVAARPARTHYRILELFAGYALVEAKLETGRTHQIRAHFAAIGHPIVGDAAYGGPSLPGLERQFLHAYRLGLKSPENGERMQFSSDLPPDLARIVDSVAAKSRRISPFISGSS